MLQAGNIGGADDHDVNQTVREKVVKRKLIGATNSESSRLSDSGIIKSLQDFSGLVSGNSSEQEILEKVSELDSDTKNLLRQNKYVIEIKPKTGAEGLPVSIMLDIYQAAKSLEEKSGSKLAAVTIHFLEEESQFSITVEGAAPAIMERIPQATTVLNENYSLPLVLDTLLYS
mmetsp:Transcript_6789/g.8210  ORF Transcript_6789/g.8210 Transcript_6789/m.8210 type:complete len:173 (+) Transcript_6789:12-530(+)